MVLYVNACVRQESRTKRLADFFLAGLCEPTEEVRLDTIPFPVADAKFLERRDRLVSEAKFDDPMFDLAKQFSGADEIVIAAPLWDLSFPASLKQYFEQINVPGVTFVYSSDGAPKSLCRAKKLTYITTVGGNDFPESFGFGYIQALAQSFYGIHDVRLIYAAGLDIVGADVESILTKVENAMRTRR